MDENVQEMAKETLHEALRRLMERYQTDNIPSENCLHPSLILHYGNHGNHKERMNEFQTALRRYWRNANDLEYSAWSEELNLDEINTKILNMKAKGSFKDKNCLNLVLVTEAADSGCWQAQTEGLRKIEEAVRNELLVWRVKIWVFWMLDSTKVTGTIFDSGLLRAGKAGRVFLLSNHLQNGQILSDEMLLSNFHLAAVLLKLEESGEYPTGILTAAYRVLRKPYYEIAQTILCGLLKYRKEELKNKLKGIYPGYYEKRKLVEELAEEARKLQKKEVDALLKSCPGEALLQAIPVHSAQDWNQADKETYGILECVYKKYYESKLKESDIFREPEKFREKLLNIWKQGWGYLRLCEIIEEDIQESWQIDFPHGGTLYDQIHGRIRGIFCNEMKGILEKAWGQLRTECELYESFCEKLFSEIRSLSPCVSETGVEKLYEGKVNKYLRERDVEALLDGFGKTGGEFCRQLLNEYDKLLNWDRSFFSGSYEDELSERLQKMGTTDRRKYISEQFETSIANYIRIRSSNELEPTMGYYLLNQKADYAQWLHQLNDTQKKKDRLINVTQTDCIEKIELYPIQTDKISQLYC